MVLTNAEKQARYRERHAKQLAAVQKTAAILMRQSISADHMRRLARLLRQLLSERDLAELQRQLAVTPPARGKRRHASPHDWHE